MKTFLALLATALLLPLVVPSGSSQATPAAGDAGVRVLEDKAADVKVEVGGQPEDASGRWAAADLRALDVKETQDTLMLTLTVGSLPANDAPIVEDVRYDLAFRHHDQVYRVVLERRITLGTPSVSGHLEAYNPARKDFQQVGPSMEAGQDVAAGTLSFPVERDLLVDREGDAPHPEVPITDWQATATGNPVFGARIGSFCFDRSSCLPDPFPSARDVMPDQGNGTAPLVLQFGIAQSGHARLFSESPTRASNGEATTIVYQVKAVNRAPRNETFSLTATGVPAGWSVRLPAQRVAIPGNATLLLPVLLSVPFAHQHGTYARFLVELTSLADPSSVGRIQLGIRYTNPPQPAGHHNVLWLHAFGDSPITGQPAADAVLRGNNGLYMNALLDDPLDAKADNPGGNCGSTISPPTIFYCWYIPLRPQLELGLDMDLARTGKLSLPLKTVAPLRGAALGGSLIYAAPGGAKGYDAFPVANIVAKAPVDVDANSAGTILEADIVPTQDGDFVPYAKGAALYLELELGVTGANPLGFSNDATAPSLQPGGILSDLPLNEYHDPVGQVFASNSTVAFLADSAQDRAVNPGKSVLFNLTLEDHGAAGVFNLELSGPHMAWARILAPGEQVKVGAGESVPVRVMVSVPASADRGDTADLVLTATSASDLNLRTLARLYAAVETDKAYPDDSGLLGAASSHAKQTPGLEPLVLVPLLLALAAFGRRLDP